MNCKCVTNLGNKLQSSTNVCCSFCNSKIACTEDVKLIKDVISENNQLEEVFYCHNHEQITETSLETKECVIHGLEFSVNKILLNNENIRIHKHTIFCSKCQNIVGRLDSMSNNQLKLFSLELVASVPTLDIDGDIVGNEYVSLCQSDREVAHLVLHNIVQHEAIKILLIGISENGLVNIALLWNLQQIFSVYHANLCLSAPPLSPHTLDRKTHYRLLCLPNTSEAFSTQFELWNRDMSVYHIMAPEHVCEQFIKCLLDQQSDSWYDHDSSDITRGFIPCSINLAECI